LLKLQQNYDIQEQKLYYSEEEKEDLKRKLKDLEAVLLCIKIYFLIYLFFRKNKK
jgi:hypothetical protein